ncbi:MAG: SsrA-binding protein SmpB [Deltaproteobacteria bacterium]|nr:SsrA-binding protein SmpB [Deltaproteobacteria bacterium]
MAKKDKKQKNSVDGGKTICENRKARFEYEIAETFEAGVVLTGSEVKSLRAGKANLTDAYADIRNEEAFLQQAHIEPYEKGGYANHEPKRTRKLLLHRKEISRLIGQTQAKGMSLVPLKMYLKNGLVKVLLGLGKGKKTIDKRRTIKDREVKRDLDRAVKR